MFEAPNCERYTYRGTGTQGRCWVCTPDEGEIKCAGCLATEAETIVVLEEGRKAAEAARLERYRRTYGFGQAHWAIEEFGSAVAAIEAIIRNVHGYREFSREVLHLLAWELPYVEAIARWHELLAISDTLLRESRSR